MMNSLNQSVLKPYQNSSSNFTESKIASSITAVYLYITFGLLIDLFILTTNISLMIGIWRTKKQLKVVDRLYIAWSLFDLPMALIKIPFTLYGNITMKYYDLYVNNVIAVAYFFTYIFKGTNVGLFIVISMLRNQSIRRPLIATNYRPVRIFSVCYAVIVIVRSLNVSLANVPSLNVTSRYKQQHYITVIVKVVIDSILILSYNINSKIFLSRATAPQVQQRLSNACRIAHFRNKRKAVKTLLVISILYVICNLITLTVYVCLFIPSIAKLLLNPFPVRYISLVLTIPMYLNTGLNAFIYMLKDKKIKRYYLSVFQSNTNQM